MLIITSTPVHRIPERLTELFDRIMLRERPASSESAKQRKAAKDKLELGEHSKPYDTPVLAEGAKPVVDDRPSLADELLSPEEAEPVQLPEPTPPPKTAEQLILSPRTSGDGSYLLPDPIGAAGRDRY